MEGGGRTSQALVSGTTGRPYAVSRGIRQGCLASGSVWAILYKPTVRRIKRLPGVFAHDVGFACNEVNAVIGTLAPHGSSRLLPVAGRGGSAGDPDGRHSVGRSDARHVA